jgi:hypothetical protein
MKTLTTFFEESNKPKDKPHVVNPKVGANDAAYFKLMSLYNRQRRTDREKASATLKKMNSMKDVSDRAKMGAAYL